MKYRSWILSTFLVLGYICCLGFTCALGFGWKDYKEHFLSPDGRVIDFYQHKISHSEGQGYGLLLALANKDKQAFEKIWKWTKDNLQMRKGDKLLCWSWGLRPNGSWQVIDYNNASDGDILVAWALYLGWKRWQEPAYKKAAEEIVKSIRSRLSFVQNGWACILPGYYGFQDGKAIILNPSYIILPAFQDFAQLDRPNFWNQVKTFSTTMLKKAVFGPWSLPPDWIIWNPNENRVLPYKKGPRFGYDAWRVFLYSSWSKEHPFIQGFEKLWMFFNKNGYLPEYVDLQKECISLKECPAGAYAALAAFAGAVGKQQEAADLYKMADKKIAYDAKDYFSASLYLLSKARFEK